MERNMLLTSLLGVSMVFAASLAHAQVIEIKAPEDWRNASNVKSLEDGTEEVTGKKLLQSKKSFEIDPAKTYKLSGEFKAAGDEKIRIYLGFIINDAKGRQISAPMVNVVPGSDTELAEACGASDTVIKIKNGSKWKNVAHYRLAINTAEDYSDLPNANLLKPAVKEVKKEGDVYAVTLSAPIGKALEAGTRLRQHAGGGFLYTAGSRTVADKWTTLSGTISGQSKSGWNSRVWPTAAAKAEILVLVNWGANNKNVTLLRNIKLEEVTVK